MTDPLARVREAASARGLEIELRERPAAKSLPEAAALLGVKPADIVKTLVVKRPSTGSGNATRSGNATGSGSATGSEAATGSGNTPEFLYALVPGDRSISWPKLRAVVGVNKLALPDPDVALAATGYERGTIVPIGAQGDWPVFADESIVGRRIAMGAGAHGYSLFVDADALIAAFDATIADISSEAG
ncbi:aminoacyl-tRNA deacylase [Microbacterium sp. NPDC055910]|uniref:aminoacyl-tRNA deacylase n=1 Tax=Microbacterium sp. NPDC055910 TaxID=3345659 RepID=UPI0035DC78F2